MALRHLPLRSALQTKRCLSKGTFRLLSSTAPSSPVVLTRSMPTVNMVESNFFILEEFITPEEEQACLDFVAPALARRRYQENHWDDVISKYKEIEMPQQPVLPLTRHGVPRSATDAAVALQAQEANHAVLQGCLARIHAAVRAVHGSSLEFMSPHVIDLAADGFIGAHVDSIKFSGKLICGLSLGSTRILRLVKTKALEVESGGGGDAGGSEGGYGEGSDRAAFLAAIGEATTPVVEALVRPRSLYVFANTFRYEYTHEVLGASSPVPSLLVGVVPGVPLDFKRRVSFMVRDTLEKRHE